MREHKQRLNDMEVIQGSHKILLLRKSITKLVFKNRGKVTAIFTQNNLRGDLFNNSQPYWRSNETSACLFDVENFMFLFSKDQDKGCVVQVPTYNLCLIFLSKLKVFTWIIV